MKLEEFRVRNYKKIRDTGWISCRAPTVFVGKNEAGKSAIFRGLSKLNPSDREKYDGLKEFPRRRLSDEFEAQDWPVASGRFSLSDVEKQALAERNPELKDVETVTVTRHYSWALSVGFDVGPDLRNVSYEELKEAIDHTVERVTELTTSQGRSEALAAIKQTLPQQLDPIRNAMSNDGSATKADLSRVINAVLAHANEEWQKELLEPTLAGIRDLTGRVEASEKVKAARKWVADNLPSFIYFDKYDVIDSSVHIPSFAQKIASGQGGPRVRTTNCLFAHVGLEVTELAGLGMHDPGTPATDKVRREIDERAILLSSASNAMTRKFEDWWEQRKHEFHYQIDGDYFRIWVSDDVDPSQIELDQRSMGMQYFFSFYTVFLVESEGTHAGCILLLDEPGLHAHGTAQAKIVSFLEKLSAENQLLYSTHSPFMVDVNHLERVRAVYEDEDGTTKVSEDVWPRDKDSLFPLQAALGYQLIQGLFISGQQVIVEGLTDLWLLRALDQVLSRKGKATLRPDVVIVPCAGLSKLLPLASMLVGHEVQVAALLDGDEPGRREGKKLVEKLLAGDDRKCLFVGDFVAKSDAEIEDIFPDSEYLSAVREAYPSATLNFNAAEKALPSVVKKVKALFERKEYGRFEKWKPAAVLRDRILASPDDVADATIDTIEKITDSLNGLFASEPLRE